MNINAALMAERKAFIRIESIVRQLAGTTLPSGIPIVPDEHEIQSHLNACRDYYELYGTKFGCNSPWIAAYNDPKHFSQIERRELTDDKS